MNIKELISQLDYNMILEHPQNEDIKQGYTSDLLSDVIANAADESCLITIQAHKNSIAVASLIGIKLIVLCNERTAPQDMIEAARQESIALAGTSDNQFIASYKIHKLLNPS